MFAGLAHITAAGHMGTGWGWPGLPRTSVPGSWDQGWLESAAFLSQTGNASTTYYLIQCNLIQWYR